MEESKVLETKMKNELDELSVLEKVQPLLI